METMTVRELRHKYGMTQKQFSEYFEIPFNTLQYWEYNKSKCAPYLLKLMIYKLETDENLNKKIKE